MKSFRTEKAFRRLVSLAVILSILVTHQTAPICAATAFPSVSENAFPESPYSLTVPAALGRIEEVYEGRKGRTVIFIQDAHAVPAAQKNIRNLIRHFHEQYRTRLVTVEGAASRFDPQLLRSYPRKEKLEEMINTLLEQGELAGPAASAILDGEAAYYGIEDWPLYEQGLGLYLKAAATAGQTRETLKNAGRRLTDEKKEDYSEKLFEIDSALEAFGEDGIDLVQVLKILSSVQAPAKGSELELILEESLKQNTAKSAQEVKNAAARTFQEMNGKQLPSDEVSRFNRFLQDFNTGAISSEKFALFLDGFAGKHGLDGRLSRSLRLRVQNQKRIQDIEGSRFFYDFEVYASEVKRSLFRNDAERILDKEGRRLRLMKSLAAHKINRQHLAELQELGLTPQYETMLANHTAFYANAEKRDEIFLKNVLLRMHDESARSAVLVAGGFHTEGLTERMKREQISYILVRPEIAALPREDRYAETMRGDVSWKSYFKAEKGRVNLYEAFMRSARDRLLSEAGEDSSVLLKEWRARVLFDLASTQRITDAHRYTKLIDEVEPFRAGPVWSGKVEGFLDSLRKLENDGRLTGENIAALLRTATMNPAVKAGIALDSLPAEYLGLETAGLPALAVTRSEMRDVDRAAFRLSSLIRGGPLGEKGFPIEHQRHLLGFLMEEVKAALPELSREKPEVYRRLLTAFTEDDLDAQWEVLIQEENSFEAAATLARRLITRGFLSETGEWNLRAIYFAARTKDSAEADQIRLDLAKQSYWQEHKYHRSVSPKMVYKLGFVLFLSFTFATGLLWKLGNLQDPVTRILMVVNVFSHVFVYLWKSAGRQQRANRMDDVSPIETGDAVGFIPDKRRPGEEIVAEVTDIDSRGRLSLRFEIQSAPESREGIPNYAVRTLPQVRSELRDQDSAGGDDDDILLAVKWLKEAAQASLADAVKREEKAAIISLYKAGREWARLLRRHPQTESDFKEYVDRAIEFLGENTPPVIVYKLTKSGRTKMLGRIIGIIPSGAFPSRTQLDKYFNNARELVVFRLLGGSVTVESRKNDNDVKTVVREAAGILEKTGFLEQAQGMLKMPFIFAMADDYNEPQGGLELAYDIIINSRNEMLREKVISIEAVYQSLRVKDEGDEPEMIANPFYSNQSTPVSIAMSAFDAYAVGSLFLTAVLETAGTTYDVRGRIESGFVNAEKLHGRLELEIDGAKARSAGKPALIMAIEQKTEVWITEAVFRWLEARSRYDELARSELRQPSKDQGGEAPFRSSRIPQAAAEVVAHYRGAARLNDAQITGTAGTIKSSALGIFISAVGVEMEKIRREEFTGAQEGFRAVMSGIDRPVLLFNDLSDSAGMSDEDLNRLAATMAGAVRANKYIAVRIRADAVLERKIRKFVQLGKKNRVDPVKLLPAGGDLLLYNQAFPEDVMLGEMTPDISIQTGIARAGGGSVQLEPQEYGTGGRIDLKDRAEVFTAALLWAADSLSKQTADILSRDKVHDFLYRLSSPSALGMLSQIGNWLSASRATATAA